MTALVWRGLVIDDEMPESAQAYIRKIREAGCPLGADGGKEGLMRGFRLLVPLISPHDSDPFEVARRVREDGPHVPRYNRDSTTTQAVCVCGDRSSALHYATRSAGTAVVIAARVDIDRLCIDGRDFLYTAVPALCKAAPCRAAPFIAQMTAVFSELIESYIEAGRALTSDAELLFRLVDHIVMDRRVIRAHLTSRVLLLGRYNTRFCSAFGVRGGIAHSEIVDVALVSQPDRSAAPNPLGAICLSGLLQHVNTH